MRTLPIELPNGLLMADLFGDVPVTLDDIRTWMLAVVPRIDGTTSRGREYVRQWNVADKIRHAKRTGKWPPTSGYVER